MLTLAPACGIALALFSPTSAQDDSCWFGGVTREHCCGEHFGPEGNSGCWDADGVYTFLRCCGLPPPKPAPPIDWAALPQTYPECIQSGIVLRHSGETAIFADMSDFGHKGCFQENCKLTDKFEANDAGVCARLCNTLDECSHWSYGLQSGRWRCFLRKSDSGRELLVKWSSGSKSCAPATLPPAFTAISIAESSALKVCDGGRDKCSDTLAAAKTWRFAIKFLHQACVNQLDDGSLHHIDQIRVDTQNLIESITGYYRPSDADFNRVVYNNRLIFNSLRDFLVQFPKVDLSESDLSLPTPLRTGELCGHLSCYEK